MPRAFLVEHYWPGLTADAFAEATRRISAAANHGRADGHPVRLLHATFVPEDEAAYVVLEAAEVADVEAAYARAGVAFERVLPAVETAGQWRAGGRRIDRSPRGGSTDTP